MVHVADHASSAENPNMEALMVDGIAVSLQSDAEGRRHSYRQMCDDYQVSETILGEGVTGYVVKARRKSLTEKDAVLPTYAVKTMHLVGAEAIKLERMQREVEVLLCLDHPHIAYVSDVYETGEATHLVMECLEGGDLCDKYNEVGRFTEEEAASTVRQMLLAIQYLHRQGIVHRDIKMEHFMYACQGSTILKLIDFGLCQRWHSKRPNMTDPVGTLSWAAPEVMRKSYTNKCDVWSLGCIAFNLLLGHTPFRNEVSKENFELLLKGAYREKDCMWETISEEAKDFVQTLLEVNPDRRPTAQEALKHPWLMRWQFEKALSPPSDIIASLEHFSRNSSVTKYCLRTAVRTITGHDETHLRDTFIAMDGDRKGTLSLHDLVDYIAVAASDHRHDIAKLLAALKADARGEVHYSEFVAVMMSPLLSTDDPIYKDALTRYCGTLVGEDLPMIMSLSTTTSSTVQTETTLCTTTSLKSKDSQNWQRMKKMFEKSASCLSQKRRRASV